MRICYDAFFRPLAFARPSVFLHNRGGHPVLISVVYTDMFANSTLIEFYILLGTRLQTVSFLSGTVSRLHTHTGPST